MFENPHFGGNDIYNKNVYITAVTRKKMGYRSKITHFSSN